MVGGDEAIFETCGELFRAMGTTILYEGGCGSGQHVKMANQIALAGAISAGSIHGISLKCKADLLS